MKKIKELIDDFGTVAGFGALCILVGTTLTIYENSEKMNKEPEGLFEFIKSLGPFIGIGLILVLFGLALVSVRLKSLGDLERKRNYLKKTALF
jgi:Mn2+/Fe2+ NRAMP family transporter